MFKILNIISNQLNFIIMQQLTLEELEVESYANQPSDEELMEVKGGSGDAGAIIDAVTKAKSVSDLFSGSPSSGSKTGPYYHNSSSDTTYQETRTTYNIDPQTGDTTSIQSTYIQGHGHGEQEEWGWDNGGN